MQWALNAYPLLRPAVTPLYHKIAGKTFKKVPIMINREVRHALDWFSHRLDLTDGVPILEAEVWGPDAADMVIYCDASTGARGHAKPGLGFWVPSRNIGLFADGDVPYPPDLVHNHELG
ncbi:hypothetical protein M408DRAFT_307899, partial [Serendipita vermifera MAFF 305830]